jgi:hypothetical protein
MFTHLSVIFCLHTPTLLFLTIGCSIFQENRSDEFFLHEASDIEMLTYAQVCSAFATSLRTKIISSPPILNSLLLCFNF